MSHLKAPNRVPGTRICLAVTRDGVKLYGNREAFQSLAQFMTWIANANPAEHFECHVKWHMSSEDALVRNGPPNIASLFAPELLKHFSVATSTDPGFDVTFMAVEEGDLDTMFAAAPSGLLPDDWRAGDAGDRVA